MQESFFHAAAPAPPSFPSPNNGFPDLQFDHPPIFDMSTPPYMRELPRPRFEADSVTRSLSSLFEDINTVPPIPTTRPSFSGQSPRLIDLLLPGSELNARPGTVTIPPISLPTSAMEMSPVMEQQFLPPIDVPQDPGLEEDVEEIVREPPSSNTDMWVSMTGQHASRSSTATPSTLRNDHEPLPIMYRSTLR